MSQKRVVNREHVTRYRVARTARLTAGIAAIAILAGCGTVQTAPSHVLSGSSSELYSGEPTILHATEIPVASAEEARTRADEALSGNDVDLALYMYVQAVNLDSADAGSFYSIGALHEQRGNTELAARAYARVVELEPGHALAQQGLGLAFFEARRFDEAKASLQRAVALDPMLWRAHDSLGIIADMERQHDLAVRHYTSAIEARPTLASIHNNRGYSKYLSGALEAAKRDFLTALEFDPDYERAWRNLGLVLARQQDYDRALGAMSRSIAKHVALNDIGYIAMLDGNYRVAQAFFEEAVIVSPRHYQIAKDNLVELSRRRSLQASTAN